MMERVDDEELSNVDGPVIYEEPIYLDAHDILAAGGPNNVLLHSATVSVGAVANTVRTLNWRWQGAASRRISSWHGGLEPPMVQGSTTALTAGGDGTNHISLCIRSGRGVGFTYRLEIFGR